MRTVPSAEPKPLPPGHAGLAAAIAKVGTAAELGRQVGVSRFAVQQWKEIGIPAVRVPAVSRLTGIPLHELRPDLFDAPKPAQAEAA
jgi:DNA-binding transcriptional regulator YdaS (Cro superfamily)